MLDGGRRRRAVVTHPPLFNDVLAVLDRAVEEMERGMIAAGAGRLVDRDKNSLGRFLIIIVHIIALAARVANDSDSQRQLRTTVFRLVRMNPRGPGRRTPLHLACCGETTDVGRYPVARFPDTEAIKTLLDANAAIDTVDSSHDTPLHLAARCRPIRPEVIRLLLARGAHHDMTNGNGETMETLLATGEGGVPLHEVVSPAKYVTLQCLAAQAITVHRIDYRGYVPTRLEAFIRMH
jgi:ankyrin repeat protein